MMQSVQVIIERLKTNPEDFFGEIAPKRVSRVPPKFEEMTQKLDDLIAEKNVGHIHRLWFLNEDEKDALIEAYKEARRARFEAKTFHELLSPQDIPEEQELNVTTRRHPVTGKYMMPTGTNSGGITAQSMVEQTTKILRNEFDKAYAKNRNT
jgi:predicted Zn-dependent protease